MTRFEDLEAKNKQLSHVNDVLNERLTRQNDVHQQDIKRLTQENVRLSQANDALNERLTRQKDDHHKEVGRLSHANAALEQRVERLEAVSRQQTTALNPKPAPSSRPSPVLLAS